jgi:hypothetical protein
MQRGFLTPLRVESVDAKNWKYLERHRWRGFHEDPDEFDIEPGELTDFASVPFWTQIILPRTGSWTKSAGLHDKMCNELNQFYKLLKRRKKLIKQGVDPAELLMPLKPRFSSIDTDAIFRKNARDEGTDPVRAELLWFGVRCGALKNPARRERWLSTSPRFTADLVAIIGTLAVIGKLANLAGFSYTWPF